MFKHLYVSEKDEPEKKGKVEFIFEMHNLQIIQALWEKHEINTKEDPKD